MNKQLLSLLIGVLCITGALAQVQVESTYTIDTAGNILDELLLDSQNSLVSLEEQWSITKPLLQQNIDGLQAAFQQKKAQCDNQEQVLIETERDLKQAQDSVDWINNKIKENNERLASLLDARCAAGQAYIESLKHDKLALKLSAFLRHQINSRDSFSLAQKKKMAANIRSFLSIYRTGNFEALVQLEQLVDASEYEVVTDTSVHGRNEEEIGAGHVDNNQADLDLDEFQNGQRQSWPEIRQELLALLDQFDARINAKIVRAQEDEIAAGSALADFKIQIEQENQRLAAELERQLQLIVQLILSIEEQTGALAVCRDEQAQALAIHDAAVEDLNNRQAEYDHKHANFVEEIQIFEDVISYYNSIRSNEDDFKGRVEDDIEDGDFDNLDYNQREVPQIDLLDE